MSLVSKLKSKLVSIAIAHARSQLEGGHYGKEAQSMWKKLLQFMNGKKTITGAILIAIPGVAAAIASAMSEAGFDAVTVARYTAWSSGSILFVVGLLHKAVKFLDEQTPDVDSDRK